MSEPIQLTYLFDPLCGWCYGAEPAVRTLFATEGVSVELAPTGVFAGTGAFPMNAGFAAHAWAADQRIGQLTGQEFSALYRTNFLENGRGNVDSGPATLALTAVRLTAPEHEFATLRAIQRARYVEGRDNSDASVIGAVLTELGLTAAYERSAAPDPELLAANRARIDTARTLMRRFGARGVPTLITGDRDAGRVIDAAALYGKVDARFPSKSGCGAPPFHQVALAQIKHGVDDQDEGRKDHNTGKYAGRVEVALSLSDHVSQTRGGAEIFSDHRPDDCETHRGAQRGEDPRRCRREIDVAEQLPLAGAEHARVGKHRRVHFPDALHGIEEGDEEDERHRKRHLRPEPEAEPEARRSGPARRAGSRSEP